MRSATVTTILVGLMSLACESGEDTVIVQTDHGEICVDKVTFERVADERCRDENYAHAYTPVWTNVGHPGPAIGQKPPAGSYSTARPSSGTIGTVPPSGGFGTMVACCGG